MEYNDFIESKYYLRRDFGPFLELDVSENKIKITDIDIIQPQLSYSECMIQGRTYAYEVIFHCKVVSGPRSGFTQDVYVEIPKMSNKGFVIANNDGIVQWRTTINLGLLNRPIRYFKGNNEEDECIKSIYFSLAPNNSMEEDPYIWNGNTDEKYHLKSYLKWLGISDSRINKYLPEDKITGRFSTDFKRIKIEKRHVERFMQKLYQLTKYELPSDELDGESLYRLLDLYHTNLSAFIPFSPFDVIFLNQYSSIIRELNSYETRTGLISEMRWQFSQNGELDGIYISRAIKNIFNFQSSSYHPVQSTADSNAGAFLSQTNKIYFITKSGDSYTKTKLKYTPDFVGLVCPFKTPEGVGLVNIKNSLTKNVTIKDEVAYITVRDKKGKSVTLSYFEYYKSRILNSTSYDYRNNRVDPDNNGEIKILHSGIYSAVKYYKSKNQFDYIDHDESSILDYSTACIPFIGHNDSVRLSMSTNMYDQAIPIEGGRPPVVRTDVEAEIYQKSDMNYKSPVNGTVVGIYKEFIKIREEDGSLRILNVPPTMTTHSHTTNRFNIVVKEGDTIKEGQIIISSNSFKDERLALWAPAIMAPFMYMGYTDDDDILISESFSKTLAHIQERVVEFGIPLGLKATFNLEKVLEVLSEIKDPKALNKLKSLNKYGLPTVGQKFKTGDIIAIYLQENDIENNPEAAFRNVVFKDPGMEPYIIELPHGMKEGEVTSVDLVVKNGITEMNEVRDYYNDLFEESNKDLMKFLENEKVIMQERPIISKQSDFRCIVRIKLRYLSLATEANKIANRYGGKGLIGKVIPDSMMPRIARFEGDKEGPIVDVIMSPNSTLNRKNLGSIYEGDLGLISWQAYKKGQEYIKDKNFEELRKMLNLINITSKFDDMSDEDLIKYHEQSNGFYSLIASAFDTSYTKEKITEILDYFGKGYDGSYQIYVPELNDFTENKIPIIVANMMRLHFIPEDKMTATGKLYLGDELVFKQGKYRSGGQRIGEQEVAIYEAKNRMDLLEYFYGKSIQDVVKPEIETQLLLQGLMIKSV